MLVYEGYCADPFVLKAPDGLFYAFGTAGPENNGVLPGGNRFVLLRSPDLHTWEALGGALTPPKQTGLGDQFWAPEVARGDDGRYYLYYSVGHKNEAGHQLRVATSERPEGPYQDANDAPLVDPARSPFTIDAHPFRDDDGQWYLFYARDFLDGENSAQAGTALAVDCLVSMTGLAGQEQTILRARFPWQLFQAGRRMAAYNNRVFDWHTLEGAFVVKHDKLYYCFYSGSAYHTPHYGVDYAVAEHVLGPYDDRGAETGPRVLRTLSDTLRGPGHNSVVVGPNGATEYFVYHAWDAHHTRRQMHVDPLVWTTSGPRVAPAP